MRYFESLDDFYNECFKYNSIKELCETLHIGRNTINSYLRNLRATFPEKYTTIKAFWKIKYDENCRIKASIRTDSIRTKYTLDDSVFDTINSESAYWLGILASDGCVHKNKNKISINAQELDREHIESFASFLKYSGKVNFRYAEAKGIKYPSVYLEIHSKHIKNKLTEYGIVPAKSNLDIDYLSYIPNEYKIFFIFGYLDGDGSILTKSVKKARPRIEILGNKSLIENIQRYLLLNFEYNGKINEDKRFLYPKYTYTIHNQKDCLSFFKQYVNCPYILKRKKQKAEEWIEYIENRQKLQTKQFLEPKECKKHKKKKTPSKPCPICGKLIFKHSKHCVECAKIVSRKVERPTKEELSNLILQYPIIKIGEMHGVSDNSVRKWLKAYDLPIKSADIKAFRELYKQSQEESSV